jgi:S1-C subfamily serine protease
VGGADLLLGGDVILNVNGIPVLDNDNSYDVVLSSLVALKPGDTLVVQVFRQGQFVKLFTPIEP